MLLDRLTERAKIVISNLPKTKKVSSTVVLENIVKTGGMGNRIIQTLPVPDSSKTRQVIVDDLVKEAYYQAVKFEHSYVGTEHLLLALYKLIDSPDQTRVKLELIRLSLFPNTLKNIDRLKKTPMLDTFTQSLNQKIIKNLDRNIIYKREYEEMVSALLLKSTSNVLLVGDPGVGKRTLIDLFTKNIISLEVPPSLLGYQVIEFDLMAFITNLLSRGGLEFGLTNLVDEIKSMGRIVLSVKNFQGVFVSSPAGMTMPVFYSMFKAAMESAEIPLIATMNTSLYDKIAAENDHLLEGFTIVEVNEPTEKETIKILEANAVYLGEFHNVDIPVEAIRTVYDKAKLISGDTKFPQKAIDLLDQACTFLILKKSKVPESYRKLMDKSFDLLSNMDDNVEKGAYDKALKSRLDLRNVESQLAQEEEKIFQSVTLKLTAKDIEDAFDTISEDSKFKIDLESISLSKLASLSERIKKRIIGQNNAIDTVAKSLIRSKLGLRSKKRPLGNFLFLGPTGVGKTELARVLADEFFGEKSLIRLDMSDFSEKHNVARLVGAPPGYVGFGEGGELTTKIESRPHSVVLFDEIEKAHPDVLNILLQITEEGELTDARGTTFDFSKSVIILTSNLGTEIIHNATIGFSDEDRTDDKLEKRLRLNLKKILKAELLNRFDEIIVFRQLNQNDQQRVLDLIIKEIYVNLRYQSIELSVSAEVKEKLLKIGYSKEYGARALRRTIEKELLDKLAEFLLSNKSRPLDMTAFLKKGEIVVKKRVQPKRGKSH